MGEADGIVFENARVFTADPARPWADTLAVRGERIVFVGGAADAAGWVSPAARRIDCGGASLLPGFIDSHFHLLYGALNLDGMQFGDVADYAQMAAVIRAYAAEHPADVWLPGTGLRYNTGPGQTPLDRHVLDALVADRPIYINAYDGHTSWANTRALELAGILHGGEAGPNSEIVLDARGLATGELREPGACLAVSRLLPKPDAARKRALLGKALQEIAARGITSVHNMDGGPETAALYAELERAGELTCRVYLPYTVQPETPLAALAGEAAEMRRVLQGSYLRGGAVKFFCDGVIENYTGLLLDAYADDPGSRGAGNYEPEHFQRLVSEADRQGFQIHTHAIGDGAVRQVLDAYAEAARVNGARDARHRIEHIELLHPADAPRFRRQGVIASMQPLHAPGSVDEGDIWLGRVGRARWADSFAWRRLRENGARLVFGSDWPVVTPDVLRGVAHALTRRPWEEGLPDQRQGLEETLLSYTREGAYAEFQEHAKGQLRAGYLADLVVLSQDIFSADPAELRSMAPRLTMSGGRVVYER